MPKKNRLTGAEIQRIRAPRRVSSALFSLSFSSSSGDGARFACVVSKKVSGKAVVRNAIKRRCREIIRTHIARLPAGTYVLYAKKGAVTAAYKECEADILKLLSGLRGA